MVPIAHLMIRSLLSRWLAWSCYVVALSTSLPAQEMLYTHDAAFHIPFHVDEGDQSSDNEVRLFYSADLGKTWHLYQQMRADAGRFTFRTQSDGEFWFAVAIGGQASGSARVPELKVMVDQRQPGVNLELKRLESGRVLASWRATDAHLDADGLKMEFLGSERQWQPVPLNVPSGVADETTLNGVAEWWVSPHLPELLVRFTAIDQAGNATSVERRLGARTPETAPVVGRDVETQLIAGNRGQAGETTQPNPPNDGWSSISSTASGSTGFRPPEYPSHGLVRLSRTRRFKLEYELDDADQGVHRVEVWHTRDRGRSWKHLGDDHDRQSPYLAEVTEDGIFGFRLVVQATEGFFAQPPMSGDPPDIWVDVDSLLPSVRMTNAQFESGPKRGSLRLSWQSSDENPTEHPVTLLFSESPEGPWRKLAEGQASSGSFDWPRDQSMPSRFYVRVEARDRVGNVNGHTWGDVIQGHPLQPQGRIRGVRPAKKDSLFDAPKLR